MASKEDLPEFVSYFIPSVHAFRQQGGSLSIEEMETIVASGTKLSIDYAINEMVDEYDQEEILEYFKNCETSSLQVAQEELIDSGYNWEQLKLIRIKFLSVYGN